MDNVSCSSECNEKYNFSISQIIAFILEYYFCQLLLYILIIIVVVAFLNTFLLCVYTDFRRPYPYSDICSAEPGKGLYTNCPLMAAMY